MTDEKNKPALDEQTFGRLIEAAFVLQEHNLEMQKLEASLEAHSERLRQQEAEEAATPQTLTAAGETPPHEADYTLTLAEIVEAQHQIQIRHLEKDSAMAVVAERIMRIARASGAGVAIVDEKMVRYRAGAGSSALPVATEVPLKTAICATCIRTGQVLRTPDVNTEFLFDPDLCRSRGILSLVGVPIYHNGEIVGALELYFERLNGYAEQDIHTCQLMAGLVTEAIGRESESFLKKSIAAERSSMMAAIEQLKPSLDSLDQPAATTDSNGDHSANPSICWKCSRPLNRHQQFCGNCGAPGVDDIDPLSFQNTVSSAWQSLSSEQPAHGSADGSAEQNDATLMAAGASATLGGASSAKSDLILSGFSRTEHEPFQSLVPTSSATGQIVESEPSFNSTPHQTAQEGSTSLVITEPELDKEKNWTSASKAREFLESLSDDSPGALLRFWRARRGDFYLIIALLLVVVVIRWGILSNSTDSATSATPGTTVKTTRRRISPDANLSAWDKLLVNLGIAESETEIPSYKGNPDTRVWVDVKTALYYCPGAELYGKTPKGKYSTQREAQLDQFEPASRRACD